MLRRALTAKQFTLMRLQHAFQHFPTLRGFGIGDANAGNLEALLGIPLGVLFVDSQRRLRDEAQPAPFEIRAQLENFSHGAKRSTVALPGHDPLVLILNLAFARSQLAQQHDDGLQHVQRLEAGDHDRLPFIPGNPLVRPAADDGRNVSRTDEGVQPHVGRIENRPDGRE